MRSVNRRIRTAPQEDSMRDSMRDSRVTADADTVTDKVPARRSGASWRSPGAPNRWRVLAGAVAAVVIVALLSGVLISLANNRKNPGIGDKSPTHTPKSSKSTATPLSKVG